MMSRVLSLVFFVAGLALLGVAVIEYVDRVYSPGVTVDEPEREITDCEAGSTHTITFRIHNPTSRTVRVVGLSQC
jgi:uncharacterized protein (DUF58 family)